VTPREKVSRLSRGTSFAYDIPMKRARIIALAIVLSGLILSWADSKESYAAEPTHPVAPLSAHQATTTLK
jgi:hypothetical protein